jgi:hypothetical protein
MNFGSQILLVQPDRDAAKLGEYRPYNREWGIGIRY